MILGATTQLFSTILSTTSRFAWHFRPDKFPDFILEFCGKKDYACRAQLQQTKKLRVEPREHSHTSIIGGQDEGVSSAPGIFLLGKQKFQQTRWIGGK